MCLYFFFSPFKSYVLPKLGAHRFPALPTVSNAGVGADLTHSFARLLVGQWLQCLPQSRGAEGGTAAKWERGGAPLLCLSPVMGSTGQN